MEERSNRSSFPPNRVFSLLHIAFISRPLANSSTNNAKIQVLQAFLQILQSKKKNGFVLASAPPSRGASDTWRLPCHRRKRRDPTFCWAQLIPRLPYSHVSRISPLGRCTQLSWSWEWRCGNNAVTEIIGLLLPTIHWGLGEGDKHWRGTLARRGSCRPPTSRSPRCAPFGLMGTPNSWDGRHPV